MIKLENTEIFGWEAAIRGMRNPKNSWSKTDSRMIDGAFVIGENDMKLMKALAKAGSDHGKFLRMINVTVDITAPLYWWKEFDTYKVGTVANSTSTMHRLTHKPFEMSDFSFDHLVGSNEKEYFDVDEDFKEIFKPIIGHETYSVTNKGRVYREKRGKFLKPSVNSSNY